MGLDYYGLLEINRSASDDDIKNAYRKLALKYHPKKNDDPEAKKRFTSIAEAYDVLSTPKFKALYDQFGEVAIKRGVPVPPGPGQAEAAVETYTFHGDPFQVFRGFFGVESAFANLYLPNLHPKSPDARPVAPETEPSAHLEHVFPLTMEEALHGTTKTVDVGLKVVDQTGRGTSDVVKTFTFRVPRGTTNGQCFYFKSSGPSGPNKSPGDVTFKAEVQPHPRYRLEGHDLVMTKNIDLTQALIGCTLDITTLDGKTFSIPITEVIKPNHRLHLKGEGLPVIGQASKGDLIVEFNINFPNQLSFRQKELLQEALVESLDK